MKREEKKLSKAQKELLHHVKKTFGRELSIMRMIPYQFLRANGRLYELNTLNKILEGESGYSVLTLAKFADDFGYDVKLVRREDDENND